MSNQNKSILLFVFLLFMAGRSALCQPETDRPIRFRKLTIHEGLSNNWTNCVMKDRQGFVWMATRNGLNKYDGYDFTIYRYQYNDSSSISDNWVNVLLEDQIGDIWIGTNHTGLNKYLRKKDKFVRYVPESAHKHGFTSLDALCFLETSDSEVWVGTSLSGILIYNRKNDRFSSFNCNDQFQDESIITAIIQDEKKTIWITTNGPYLYRYETNSEKMRSIQIPGLSLPRSGKLTYQKVLFQDSDGDIWIGSRGNGIWLFHPENETFDTFTVGPGTHQLSHPIIRTFAEYGKGKIWIGADNGGINIYDKQTGFFKTITANVYDPYALNSNGIYDLYVDDQNNLWVSTFNGGVNLYARNRYPFDHFQHILNDAQSLSHNHVISLERESNGIIWVGTDGGGLNRFNPESGTFETYSVPNSEGSAINSRVITALEMDSRGRLWVAGFRDGVSSYDIKTGELIDYYHDPANPTGLSNNSIWAIHEDRKGSFWFGTLWAGLSRLDPQTGIFTHFRPEEGNPNSISNMFIMNIYEDRQGNIWIATEGGGLEMYDETQKRFIHYQHDPKVPCSISSNVVYGLHETKDGFLWTGTGDGLNRLDAKRSYFTTFRIEDGLPDNQVYDIAEDDAGRLWLSTANGLSCFNREKKTFTNYYDDDGLQSNQFSKTACTRTDDGQIYFGGIGGLTCFDPNKILRSHEKPTIVFTDFLLFNRSVAVNGKNSILKAHIASTELVELSHRQNVFSIQFAAIDFDNPEKIKYRFRLVGFDEEWITIDAKERKATYTNLAGGDYVFQVRSSNNDGIWSDNTISLKIKVHPPFWETWLFRGLLILIMAMAVGITFRVRTQAIRKQNSLLERINKALTNEIKERVHAEKVAKKSLEEKGVLLQEIHHRVKNNMQIIQSLMNLQSQKIKDPGLQGVFNDSRSRIRSMALIHDKLYQSDDLAKIDFSEYTELLVRELVKSHHYSANQVKIQLDIKQKILLPVNLAVPAGLVINEIITNALKYAVSETRNGGPVLSVKMHVASERLNLLIADNGPGIPGDVRPETSDSLGLTLIDMLVKKQLKGSYSVESEGGTLYKIRFKI